MSDWWIEKGFPPFDPGGDGFPRPGQVLKAYRCQTKRDDGKPWTQANLANVLGITEKAVRDLENRDIGMDSYKRRRFLADLFNIPPILLGITSLEAVIKQQEGQPHPNASQAIPTSPLQKTSIDIIEYHDALVAYWEANHTDTAEAAMQNILERMNHLSTALPSVRGWQEASLVALTCQYHQLAAVIVCDQAYFDSALDHLNKAVMLAKHLQDDELRSLALYRRAGVYFDRWELFLDHRDIVYALRDYSAAHSLEHAIPAQLKGAILLEFGNAQAKIAQSQEEKSQALRHIDEAGTIVRQGQFDDDGHFLSLSEEWYHNDRGATLIALGRSGEALRELALVKRQAHPDFARRYAYNDLLEAQAYMGKGQFPLATTMAEASLIVMKEIHSRVNIARISRISTQLKESTYRNNPEVARLDFLLQAYP
ncbi:MAG TPA: hypothetical protein VKR06_00175 [Ktedonosporobacter sp.]|nr:hypothetical protein [Ktedonosporobacter sp.]